MGVQDPFGFLAVCRGHPSKAAVGESSQATQRDLHTPGGALEQQVNKKKAVVVVVVGDYYCYYLLLLLLLLLLLPPLTADGTVGCVACVQ